MIFTDAEVRRFSEMLEREICKNDGRNGIFEFSLFSRSALAELELLLTSLLGCTNVPRALSDLKLVDALPVGEVQSM